MLTSILAFKTIFFSTPSLLSGKKTNPIQGGHSKVSSSDGIFKDLISTNLGIQGQKRGNCIVLLSISPGLPKTPWKPVMALGCFR